MTKWAAIMNYIHGECRGGPVLGPHLEAMAITRFSTTASTMTARLRELRDCGFLTQESGRIGARSKRYVAYTCNAIQWNEWTHAGPEILRSFLNAKRKHRRVFAKENRTSRVGTSRPRGAAGVEVGGSPSPARAPAAQLTLGDAAAPKRHWERG